MKVKSIFISLLVIIVICDIYAQNYTSYFIGNTTDVSTNPTGGICMMGGRKEDDNAMRWFLQRAAGGDILVLRASGSDGYNDYMFNQLGVNLNSVESIVFHNAQASNESYIQNKIQQAEGIWFAGGDQWNYISYWQNTDVITLINEALTERNIVIGGTSAGMAILGEYYFSAQNGTVTSAEALINPYDSKVTVSSDHFLHIPILNDVITDTHYDERSRQGRHTTFLARMRKDDGIEPKGIACDEYTSVCIDENGIASVYGDPSKDDYAYFITANCELPNTEPENCSSGNPLDWNLNNKALNVYKVKGNSSGSNTIDLKDWRTTNGGNWEYWYVNNGALNNAAANLPVCNAIGN